MSGATPERPDGQGPQRSGGHGSQRATGASLAAVLLTGATFAAVMALHVVRRDMDPVRQAMSEYANGTHGVLMTLVFYAFGLAVIALGVRIRRAITGPAARPVPILLVLAGAGLVASGAFEVGEPAVPDTLEEVVHSVASIAAFLLLIGAMILLSVASRADGRWWTFRRVSTVLAAGAAVAAIASPLADGTAWSGLVQRVLALLILLWVLLTALRVRVNASRAPDAGRAGGGPPAAGVSGRA